MRDLAVLLALSRLVGEPLYLFGDDVKDCDVHVDARVQELIYLGDHIRTRLTVCGRDDFVVKIPNSTDRAGLVPGNEISLGWRTRDCRALDMPDSL